MLKMNVVSEIKFIPPNDPAIDLEKWEDPENYLSETIKLPPIKKGEKATVFTLRPLTNRELSDFQTLQFQEKDTFFSPTQIEFVIRRGVKNWENIFINGEEISPKHNEDNILTKESYEVLLPFSMELILTLAMVIYKSSTY